MHMRFAQGVTAYSRCRNADAALGDTRCGINTSAQKLQSQMSESLQELTLWLDALAGAPRFNIPDPQGHQAQQQGSSHMHSCWQSICLSAIQSSKPKQHAKAALPSNGF